MNCEKGDLAVVFKSRYGNLGKIVTCIRLANANDYREHMAVDPMEPVWLVDNLIQGSLYKMPLVRDSRLRPLRDNPGQDQTLDWAPVPSKEKA